MSRKCWWNSDNIMSNTSRKPFPWRGVSLTLFAVLALAVLGFYARFWALRAQAERHLARVVADLDRDDPGWRFEDIEAARETIPDSENGALVVLAAKGKLPRNWNPYKFDDMFKEAAANELLSDDAARAIATELRLQAAALAEGRKLIGYDKGRYEVHHEPDPSKTLLPHLGDRRVINLLRLDAVHEAHTRNYSEALRSCRAMAGTARAFGDESLHLTLLMRCVFMAITCSTAERVLGQGVCAEEDLLALQKILEKEDSTHLLLQGFRTERACNHKICENISEEERKPGASSDPDHSPQSGWLPSRERENFIRGHAEMLELSGRFVKAVQQPLPVRREAMAELARELQDIDRHRPNAVFLLLGGYARIEERDRQHHARLRCAAAMLAAERFRLKENRWPETTAELKTLTAADTLIDPCDGKPLRLRREADGLLIYSVGVNGVDEGGKLEEDRDIGYRLWNPASRRQPAKPLKPKPPDE